MHAIATLQRFASDGLVYRAFDHAVVAAMGLVVAVPLWHTEGCLKELPDQSPVPWMELWAVLDIEPARQAMFDRDLAVPDIIRALGYVRCRVGTRRCRSLFQIKEREMQKRIVELAAQSPCSIEYLADVLQQPTAKIEAELNRLVHQGRLKAEKKTIYRAETQSTATEAKGITA